MDQIHDRDDFELVDQVVDGVVDPGPIVDAGLRLGLVPRHAVADGVDSRLGSKIQILLPFVVVLHLHKDIQQPPVAVFGRVDLRDPTVLDADAPVEFGTWQGRRGQRQLFGSAGQQHGSCEFAAGGIQVLWHDLYSLKDKFQGQRHPPGRRRKRADAASRRRVDEPVRRTEVGRVGYIKEFAAELQACSVGQPEILEQSCIEIDAPRVVQNVASGISISVKGRQSERSLVLRCAPKRA